MDQDPAPRPLTTIDAVLLRAVRVWGNEAADELWEQFRPDWRSTLRWGWDEVRGNDRELTLRDLMSEHGAQVAPDLARIHSSWWIRALKEESPAVQRAVAARAPSGIGEALREGLGFDEATVKPDRWPHPTALNLALTLWTVRLAGDLDVRNDDPPVILALTRFDSRDIARFFQAVGLAKWSITAHDCPTSDPKDVARFKELRDDLSAIDSRFIAVAERDISVLDTNEPRIVARLGLVTFARLLLVAEPYRVRWALQHLPYPAAKSLRSLMGPDARRIPIVARWEAEVLRVAWMRLHEEGRISIPWESPT